jgi:flagellar protein FlaG
MNLGVSTVASTAAAAPKASSVDAPANNPAANPSPAPSQPETKPKIEPIKADFDVERVVSNQDRLKQAVQELNELVRDGGRGLQFAVDESLGRPIVTVTNEESGEVVRQIPGEVVLRLARRLFTEQGNLFDKRA